MASSSPLHRSAFTNGIELHYLEQGEGIPIVMLHGFPDHAAAWRPLAERLAQSCRLIAPDQRGYRQTSRPLSVADYHIDLLIGDVVGLLDVLDLPQVSLCGHDWGGVLAFELAARYPDRVSALVAFNAPPSSVLQEMIWNDPGQRVASQYINVLRSPEADAIFNEANVEALVERFLGEPQRCGLLSEEDMAAYRSAWTQPGVWRAMLAWYRAAPFDVPAIDAPLPVAEAKSGGAPLIDCPALVIWGDQDAVFVPDMADAIALACRDCRVEHIALAGHVPHRDDPDRCAVLVKDFLLNHPIRPAQKE